MKIEEIYKNLPYDLSGARVKNRFDFEILYGIELIIDNYHLLDDFCVVFDYVCDIELHCIELNNLKFYQLKSSNTGKPNNISFLTNKEKESKDSIIGKLYKLLSYNDGNNISVLLVSNAPLIDNKFVTKPNEPTLLDKIEDKTKEKIVNHLKEEMGCQDINLNNVYYLYRTVGVDDYENILIGKLNKFYEKEKNSLMNKPTVLFNSIKAVATTKAKYEKKCSFEELYSKKGISREEFNKMIKYHYEKNNEIYENCQKQILENTRDDAFFQLKCTKALSNLINGKDQKILDIIGIICDTIIKDNNKKAVSIDFYARNFKKDNNIDFPIYLSDADIYTMVIYSFEKIKEELKCQN